MSVEERVPNERLRCSASKRMVPGEVSGRGGDELREGEPLGARDYYPYSLLPHTIM